MRSSNHVQYAGPGLAGWVFLIFLTLKLAEIGPVADWSWWWVTAPLWISAAIAIFFFLGAIVYLVVAYRRKGRFR